MNLYKIDQKNDCWNICHTTFDCLIFSNNTDNYISCKKNLYTCWNKCITELQKSEPETKRIINLKINY